MMQRGRKGALASVSTLPVQRLEVPAELNDEQGQEYRAIVGSVPSEWFDAGSLPLLAAMCRHVCEERRLGKLLSEFDLECLKTPEGLKLYEVLSRNHERQSKAASQLATKMRLTQLSKYRADKASTLSQRAKAAKPWETDEED